jgi:hypothetical protein
VIRVHIALSHRLQMLLVVSLSVLLRVGGLNNFLGLCLDVLHFSLVSGLEFGLHIEGDRAELTKSQTRVDNLTKE